MEMELWLEQIINGLTVGGVYALIALGYTMVYGILLMINFAHGEIFMIGAYAGYFTLTTLLATAVGQYSRAFALLLAIVSAMIASSVLAVLLERVVYRPLRNAPRLAALISAIGASIFLQNIVLLLAGPRMKIYPDVFPSGSIDLGYISISYIRAFIILLSIFLMIVLYLFVQKTKTGKCMRAVAEDMETASLMGIDVDRIIVTTFFLGAVMAGAAGVMVGIYYTQINHMMGFIPGIKAFTAAVLGGIGNIPGAMLGGFFIGIAETIGAQILPAEYKDVIAFSILVLLLIFRPTGLLGEVITRRS